MHEKELDLSVELVRRLLAVDAGIQAIGCLWYYRDTNPVMSQTARTTLVALLDAS